MGKGLLILIVGFAASFGILAQGKNRRYVESVDRMVDRFGGYTAKNASASGAYMALNQLYLNPNWRAGFTNLALGGNVFSVSVQDQNQDAGLGPYKLRILANGGNADAANQSDVTVFTRRFQEFAVWAKDSVRSVTSQDSNSVINSALTMEKAPFMPKVDKTTLINVAESNGRKYTDPTFAPSDGFPNGNFYKSGTTPNVIYVTGNLKVAKDRTIYGIYVVEGNVLLKQNAKVNGILYLPNSSSSVLDFGVDDKGDSDLKGGIVTWGAVNGNSFQITVKHFPEYWRAFANNYAANNPPLRVLSWK